MARKNGDVDEGNHLWLYKRLLDHQHRRNPCQLFGLVWLLEFPWLPPPPRGASGLYTAPAEAGDRLRD